MKTNSFVRLLYGIKSQFLSLFALLLFFTMVVVPARADLDVLVIGSTHSYSERNESGVVQEKAFNPTSIAMHLQSILSQDSAIAETVNVEFEDIYKNKFLNTPVGGQGTLWNLQFHCYSLIQHFMWPEDKDTRLANLRGEGDHVWDYIILCGDPYVMANFPGIYAEGVQMIHHEISQSANPAQVILLAQWPENSSGFSANDFNEIVYRVGDSGGLTVVPAGKVWDAYSSQDTSSSHPTPKGEYLAAASIYSTIYDRSAKTSDFTFATDGDVIADHALSIVQANAGVSQFTGFFSVENPFQMKYVRDRTVSYTEYGTSTEEGFHRGIVDAFAAAKVSPDRRGGSASNPVNFTYSRGNDWFEADKQYNQGSRLENGDRTYGFPMGDHRGTAETEPGELTMRYGIDKRYYEGQSLANGTDLGIAYSMVRENEVPLDVRAIPVRLLWSKMQHFQPSLTSHRDGWHLSNELDRAVGAYIYTSLSGRCPIDEEPTDPNSTNWKQWWCRKIGYETAWQMSHLTTRVPGFRVTPSSASATSVTPATHETMSVEFVYPPQNDVTVTVSCSNHSAAISGPKTLIFTPSNYNTPQEVTVAGLPGAAASEDFDVIFSTTSSDEVFNGLSDSWSYSTTRSSTETVAHVDAGTSNITCVEDTAVAMNLNVATANDSNTILIGPSNGSVQWLGDGLLEYTPATSYLGADQVVYAITSDGTQTIGCLDITVQLPDGQVSVTATDATASEEGLETGSFVISRLGQLESSLEVLFSMSGSATLGSDYTLSQNSPVTIPAGQSSVTITLTPVDDSVYSEFTESAVLTITEDDAYPIGAASALITIADNDNTLPSVDAGPDQTVTMEASTAPGEPVVGAYFEWDASADTPGDNVWKSTTANSYDWTFDSGNQTPESITDSRFDQLTHAYSFPATQDASSGSWDGFGSTQPATFEFVIDVDGNDGSIFECGGSGDGLQIDVVGGVLRGTCQEGTPARASYTLTEEDLGHFIHVVFVADPVNDVVQLYVDGELKDSAVWDGPDWAGTDPSSLGGRAGTMPAGGSAAAYNGKMALFRFYKDKAFNSEEVTTNFKSLGNQASTEVDLDATVTDPEDVPTTSWSLTSGPDGASVTFGDATSTDTTAIFSAEGTYTLRLTANDGYGEVFDEVTISVETPNPDDNNAPVVDAGTDQAINLGGFTPWTPADMATVAWFDANALDSITEDGGLVSQWDDKSGNNHHASQGTSGQQPTYTASDTMMNGMSSIGDISASGSIGLLTSSFGAMHVYVVAYYKDGVDAAFDGYSTLFSGPEINGQYRVMAEQGTANFIKSFNFNTSGTYKNGSTTNTSNSVLPMSASIFKFKASQLRTQIWALGFNQLKSDRDWQGAYSEWIFTDGSEDAETEQKIEGYLAHKWNLDANLPEDHPYKSLPPDTRGVSTNLDGSVSDDDGDSLTTTWSLVDGPAEVQIEDSSSVDTSVTFTETGVYTLRLTASDGLAQTSDDVEITVSEVDSSTTYTEWIAGFDVGGLTGFADDYDGDNIPNGLENYFGTDPSLASTGVVTGTVATGASTTFTFSHPLSTDPASNITVAYIWSKNLTSFHDNGATDDGTTVTVVQGTPSNGRVTATVTVTGNATDRLFVKVQATEN